jgi:NAD(P)-dependent dehydrogenase (short-subunit alcohol dehydrogenase family)
MDLKLNDKVAFISGSTAGIGFAIAKRFLSEGARVIINGRTKESVDKAVSELASSTGNPNVSGIFANFSKVDEVNRLIAELPDIDILINNAGATDRKKFF